MYNDLRQALVKHKSMKRILVGYRTRFYIGQRYGVAPAGRSMGGARKRFTAAMYEPPGFGLLEVKWWRWKSSRSSRRSSPQHRPQTLRSAKLRQLSPSPPAFLTISPPLQPSLFCHILHASPTQNNGYHVTHRSAAVCNHRATSG